MVRHYQRKTNRGSWSEDGMIASMHAVREENMSCNMAAANYGIPEPTLRRYLKAKAEVSKTEL